MKLIALIICAISVISGNAQTANTSPCFCATTSFLYAQTYKGLFYSPNSTGMHTNSYFNLVPNSSDLKKISLTNITRNSFK